MQENCTFDYAVIRVVPRVEREEFINAGVILSCPAKKFLAAAIDLNEAKLKALAPNADVNAIRRYLEIIPKICAGDERAGIISKLSQRERFYWLTATRSTIIQISPVHTGFAINAEEMLENLLNKMVR